MLSSLVFANLQALSFPPLQKSANSRSFLFNHLRTLLSLLCTLRQVISFLFNRLRNFCRKHPGVLPLSALQAPAHA